MIRAEGLVKHYGATRACDGVDFEVPGGSVAGFLGPNGAGKTTTLRLLTTFLSPDAGRAVVAGFDTGSEPAEVRRSIGYLPERPPLDLDHTVREYLGFCATLRGLSGRARRTALAREVERCGLAPVAGRVIGNLSKGYRQRVGLAQALLHEPPVLLLDEPTAGLDPAQIVEMRALVRSFAGKRTVLLSSHRLSEIAMTCSRALIIHRGRIVDQGPMDALTADGGLEARFVRALADEEAPEPLP